MTEVRRIQKSRYQQLGLNRTHAKLIRIARTIADLAGSRKMADRAIEEAIKWKIHSMHYQDEIENVGLTHG